MTVVAMSSDMHLDLNRVEIEPFIQQQVQWFTEKRVDLFLIAGDIFNDFTKTLNYLHQLRMAMPTLTTKFVAGNHDMLRHVTFEELESPVTGAYLHNQFYDVPETNWRVVGNNGWYDYGFAANLNRAPETFEHWKRAYWVDGQINQALTDEERMQLALKQSEKLFKKAKQADKHIIFLTHFVPEIAYIRFTDDDRFWNMANGFLGSPKMGQLIHQYQVEAVQFGHIHDAETPRQINGTWYFNQAVGVSRGKQQEWHADSYFQAWQQKVMRIGLNDDKMWQIGLDETKKYLIL